MLRTEKIQMHEDAGGEVGSSSASRTGEGGAGTSKWGKADSSAQASKAISPASARSG